MHDCESAAQCLGRVSWKARWHEHEPTTAGWHLRVCAPSITLPLHAGHIAACLPACLPACRQPLTNKLRLRVRDEQDGPWREVTVPRNVRALVLLNIQVMKKS